MTAATPAKLQWDWGQMLGTGDHCHLCFPKFYFCSSGPKNRMAISGCCTLVVTILFSASGVCADLVVSSDQRRSSKGNVLVPQHLRTSLLTASQCQSRCSLVR